MKFPVVLKSKVAVRPHSNEEQRQTWSRTIGVKYSVMLLNCCTFMGCSLPCGAQVGRILRLNAHGEGL